MQKKPPSRMQVRKTFGKTIRSLRNKVGLGQEALALETGIARSYMSGIERGMHTPTLDTIYRLIGPLGVTLPEFCQEFERILHSIRRRPPSPTP